jgi:hypothetical protein
MASSQSDEVLAYSSAIAEGAVVVRTTSSRASGATVVSNQRSAPAQWGHCRSDGK